MGNFKCIKPASHRNKSRWPGTNQEKKKSHQNLLESQPKCDAHFTRQRPPRYSAPRSLAARKCAFFLGLPRKVMGLTACTLRDGSLLGLQWGKCTPGLGWAGFLLL